MEITPLAPPSVQLVPAKEYNGAPIGTSYDVRAYIGESQFFFPLFILSLFCLMHPFRFQFERGKRQQNIKRKKKTRKGNKHLRPPFFFFCSRSLSLCTRLLCLRVQF